MFVFVVPELLLGFVVCSGSFVRGFLSCCCRGYLHDTEGSVERWRNEKKKCDEKRKKEMKKRDEENQI